MSKAEETTLNYNFQDDVKGKKKRKPRTPKKVAE